MVIGWTVYYSVWNASEGQLQRMLGAERIDQADALRFREAIRQEVGEKVLLRLLLLIFIAFVFTVFATHRMIGPIRHMEKNLRAYLRGEPSKPIRLRKTDEFQDLAKLINEALLKAAEIDLADIDKQTGEVSSARARLCASAISSSEQLPSRRTSPE